MLSVSAVYLVTGLVFTSLAASAPIHPWRTIWRLTAWLTGAAVFAGHIRYEELRLHSSPRTAAFHVSLAVALGAFAFAVAANKHAHRTAPGFHRLHGMALVIWPVVSAVPAFVIALAAAALKRRV